MYHSKVVICGVNTSKLKVLTEEEKREYEEAIRRREYREIRRREHF